MSQDGYIETERPSQFLSQILLLLYHRERVFHKNNRDAPAAIVMIQRQTIGIVMIGLGVDRGQKMKCRP